MKAFVILAIAIAFPHAASAQAYSGECGTCVNRKQRICADECESVPAERARTCQQRCIAEYCQHKCAADAPELEAYLNEHCDDCLEQQFSTCESHCTVGTPRKKAVCQIECSKERCAKVCSDTRGTAVQ
ncbi:MAG: hypothetical protein U0136_04205 [Bdellovibrionota bacterium]